MGGGGVNGDEDAAHEFGHQHLHQDHGRTKMQTKAIDKEYYIFLSEITYLANTGGSLSFENNSNHA